MAYRTKVEHAVKEGKLTPKLADIILQFYSSYIQAIESTENQKFEPLFSKFLELVLKQLDKPYNFDPFHQRILKPFDYYHFGLDFIRPLILMESSKVLRLDMADKMAEQVGRGENVILLANHQTEPDPQAISVLLEKSHPRFAEEMIFVAGHRVISDPLAVPFSKGRNLLCIFSKKHLEYPPEQKQIKLLHNQKTMKRMSQLLQEGGKCIYVAPSGGRDRPNAQGILSVSSFDPQSIEMFYLMAQQSSKMSHFYPLALSTYNLLPPPHCVERELMEKRQAQRSAVHMAFGPEIDMENFPGASGADKRAKRKLRAEYIWKLVDQDYQTLVNGKIS